MRLLMVFMVCLICGCAFADDTPEDMDILKVAIQKADTSILVSKLAQVNQEITQMYKNMEGQPENLVKEMYLFTVDKAWVRAVIVAELKKRDENPDLLRAVRPYVPTKKGE